MVVRHSKGGAAAQGYQTLPPPLQTSTMTVLPYCKYDLMFESWNSVPEPNFPHFPQNSPWTPNWGPWGTCFLGHQFRYNRNCPSIRYVWLFHNFSMNNVLAADINSISLIIFQINEIILQQTWQWNFFDLRCVNWDLHCVFTVLQLSQDYELMSPAPPV